MFSKCQTNEKDTRFFKIIEMTPIQKDQMEKQCSEKNEIFPEVSFIVEVTQVFIPLIIIFLRKLTHQQWNN